MFSFLTGHFVSFALGFLWARYWNSNQGDHATHVIQNVGKWTHPLLSFNSYSSPASSIFVQEEKGKKRRDGLSLKEFYKQQWLSASLGSIIHRGRLRNEGLLLRTRSGRGSCLCGAALATVLLGIHQSGSEGQIQKTPGQTSNHSGVSS